MLITSGFVGLSSGLGLILAIGSQNAFVLRQGLMRQHVFPLVLFCAVSDAILIGAGVLGFGVLVERAPLFPAIMLWFGVAFLIFYGISRLRAAWQGSSNLSAGESRTNLHEVLLLAGAFTWLNPHVYLDTVALMGSISTCFVGTDEKISFFLGGAAASLLFFFALGFGAKLLAPLLASPRAWRILDLVIALIMFLLALKLILGGLDGSMSSGC